MTYEEITNALVEIHANLVEKLSAQPSITPTISMHANGVCYIHISPPKKYDALHTARGSSFEECLADARAYIAALPSPEEAVTREYLGKVAAAIDYATENSIADEYVTPLRGVTCAMTENLLTKETA